MRPTLRLSAFLLAGLSLAAAALPVVAARPAAADAISDKRAEAARLSRELDKLAGKVASAVEDYNEARVRADAFERRLQAAAADVKVTDARMTKVRSRVREQAIAAYIDGGDAPVLVIVAQAKPDDDLAVRQVYIRSVALHTADMLDELRAVRMRLEEQQHELAVSRDEARDALRAVDARRREATRAADAQRRALDKVKGELRTLVDAEARRKAEETARRVQADLAARRARQAASRNAAAPTAGEAGTAVVGAPSAGAAAAVAEARRQIGKPYRYGASGPNSFDCSGLTSFAWRAGGRTLPHSSRAQWSATSRVPIGALQPGDLVFYGRPIHHVGIYVGDGQMVEASETGEPVRQTTIYRSDLVGAGRVN